MPARSAMAALTVKHVANAQPEIQSSPTRKYV
jgi:hypothetical protein